MKKAISFSHHRVGKGGQPIYYDSIGKMDMAALKKVSSADELLRYFIWYQEATSVYR